MQGLARKGGRKRIALVRARTYGRATIVRFSYATILLSGPDGVISEAVLSISLRPGQLPYSRGVWRSACPFSWGEGSRSREIAGDWCETVLYNLILRRV